MSATIQVKIEELINYAAVHLEEQMIVGDIKISGLEGSQVVCRIL